MDGGVRWYGGNGTTLLHSYKESHSVVPNAKNSYGIQRMMRRLKACETACETVSRMAVWCHSRVGKSLERHVDIDPHCEMHVCRRKQHLVWFRAVYDTDKQINVLE